MIQSKNQIKKAGKKLRKDIKDNAYFSVVSTFRTNHKHQLNVIYLMTIRKAKKYIKILIHHKGSKEYLLDCIS